MLRIFAIAMVTLCAVAQARGQESLFLVEDGGRLRLMAGERAAAWTAHPVSWVFTRGDGAQSNQHRVQAEAADASALAMPGAGGGHVAGADFAGRTEVIETGKWAEFLNRRTATEGKRGAGQVRVRRLESVKVILLCGGGGDGSPVSKTGQAVEIRALMDPTLTPVGSDVALRVYSDGAKIAKARLTARHESGQVQYLRADGDGIANLRITAAGKWRVEMHHATALAGDPAADWELRTATLTFTAPGDGR